MSILYPLMALGVLAVAVPIWLHLRRRDETNLIEFSALRFLDDQPLARSRPLRPRNWPLLLLRLLALLLLVAAFMWPYVEGEETVIVEESRVYILDNTLSHQVDRGFELARDQIVEELSNRDLRVQIGVVELSTTARVVVRLGDDPAAALEAVQRLRPSSERGNFVDAFRAAGEMLSNSLGEQRRIVLLSDSQSNQWTVGKDVSSFLENVEVDLPVTVAVPPGNWSLSGVQARRVIREGQHWIEAGAVLAAQGGPGPATVVFRHGGRQVAQEEIDIESEDAMSVATRVVLAEWPADPDRWVLGEVLIEGDADALAGDNRVVFSLPPLRPGRIEVVADSLFLRRALDPQVMFSRWDVQFSDPSQLMDRDGELAPDLLCVESRALSSSAVREAIRDDLSRGRGVMLMIDSANPLIAGFLRDFGIDLESPSSAATEAATFRYLFGEHPVFAPFRSGELGNLAEVTFADYRRLGVRDATPLAFSARGDPLLFEVNAGPGRMLVFAFAFERRDTNWPIQPSFIPFLDKCLDHLRGEARTIAAFEPGESVVWELPMGTLADEVSISPVNVATGQPEGGDFDSIRAEVRDRTARFQLPPASGHFAVRLDDSSSFVAVLDVNPSPLESDLTYEAEPDAIAAWVGESDDGPKQASDPKERLRLSNIEAMQQPYAWYLLIAAVAAFLTETVCSARMSRGV